MQTITGQSQCYLILTKFFDKLIHARLNNFIEKKSILSKSQYGFRKGHSTSHGITELQNKITDNLEKKKICAVLFIDLKSAFDTIDPKILTKKLKHYGIRGNIIALLTSYLTNRKQFLIMWQYRIRIVERIVWCSPAPRAAYWDPCCSSCI